jgi:hypothetical protein
MNFADPRAATTAASPSTPIRTSMTATTAGPTAAAVTTAATADAGGSVAFRRDPEYAGAEQDGTFGWATWAAIVIAGLL